MNVMHRIATGFFCLLIAGVGCQDQDGENGNREESQENGQVNQQGNGGQPAGGGTTPAEFEPSGPFRLSQDGGQHQTPPGTEPNEVKIVFNPDNSARCNACDEIVIIQTVQMFVDGQRIRPGQYSTGPLAQVAETTTIPDQPGTPDTNEDGTFLDSPNAPATHGSTPGSKVPGYTTSTGISVPPTESDAELIDPPMAEGGDRGFRTPNNPNGYQTIVWKFESCAYCEGGLDAGNFYECITWEHTRTAADAAANPSRKGNSKLKGQDTEPTAGFREAYRKFKQEFP